MRMSRDHILTSQAGSLPRPDDLIEANRAREAGETTDERRYQDTLQTAVTDVVRKQKDSILTGWRLALFAFLYRNSVKVVDRFSLTPENVIEIARQIEI